MKIRSPYLPEANFGLRVLSLPACECVCVSICLYVCVSVNRELVGAITHQPFKLEPLNQKMQNNLVKVPIVFFFFFFLGGGGGGGGGGVTWH